MAVVGILIFDEVDLIDAGGPYEVFLTASRLAARAGEPEPFEVVTISPTGEPIEAYGGLRLAPHRAAAEVERLDVLLVPGAVAIERIRAQAPLREALRRLAPRSGLVVSVCTGAFLLADLGLLDGRRWTTHWEDVEELSGRLGADGATRGARWVDEGEVVASGGLSSGLAGALHVVDRLAGRRLALATTRQLDYDWDPNGAGAVTG